MASLLPHEAMDDNNNTSFVLNFNISTKGSFRIRRMFNHNSIKTYRITFKFSCGTTRVHDESISQPTGDMTKNSFVHHLSRDISPADTQTMHRAIETHINIWSLPILERVPTIVNQTMSMIEFNSRNICRPNDFVVEISYAQIFCVSRDHMLRVRAYLNFEDVGGTDQLDIKTLERKVMRSNEDCVICLEELPEGCEAVTMPCSHTFHGGCIEKWLRTSRSCPVCRFELPTNKEQTGSNLGEIFVSRLLLA